jgi:hypothetical protein
MPMFVMIAVAVLLQQMQASNAQYGYRFNVPAGFVAYPEGRTSGPDFVDCWREEPADSTGGLALCVQHLGGTIGRDTLLASDVPAKTTLHHFRWREFDLQGFIAHATQDSVEISSVVTQVPLRKEAIQLVLAGPVSGEARAIALMDGVLASLDGESNWLTSEQRAERFGQTIGYWLVAFIGIGVLVWMYRRRKRRGSAR